MAREVNHVLVYITTNFTDGLIHTQDGEKVTLSLFLAFFTGADREPPLGFPKVPELHFLHRDAILVTASTCDLILRVPAIYHDNYDKFRDIYDD